MSVGHFRSSRLLRRPAQSGARARKIARFTNRSASRRASAVAWSRLHARLLRISKGRAIPRWFGAPVVVLETVGRKSGKRRETPVLALSHGPDLVVMAASAGTDAAPAWWLNLQAAGEATVLMRGERRTVQPRVTAGEEHARLWPLYLAMYPAAEHYSRYTDRELPLIVLEPKEYR